MDVAARALEAQPVPPHGFQMGAAGDESHVIAGLAQKGAEITADAAGPHDRNAHNASFFSIKTKRNLMTWTGGRKPPLDGSGGPD